MVHQGTLHQSTGPHPVHRGDRLTSAGQPVKHLAESGEVYIDFETAREFSVVIVSAESYTQTMLRVVSLEEELLDVPEYQEVPMEVDTILVSQEGQPPFRSHTCLCLICEFGRVLCFSRGYFGLQVQRFGAHSAWYLRSDGREHGGRGFRAGRTRLSTARMAHFRGIGTGEYHMRRPTTSKLLLADPCVPILCGFLEACNHCRDCSRPSPDDFRALSRRKSSWSLTSSFLTS